MKYLISIFIYIYKLLFINRWNDEKLKILLNERKSERLKFLLEALSNQLESPYQVKVPKNKFEFIILAKNANVIFSYGLSRYIKPCSLKLYYHALVGDLNKDIVNCKIISPPNFASVFIADYVFAAVVSFEKKLLQNSYLHNNRIWKQTEYIQKPIRKLSELKIGILGLGQAGIEIADRFLGINCNVFGFDVRVNNGIDKRIKLVKDWQSMLSNIDYFVIAVSDSGNEKLVNQEAFSMMNESVCIVNISRMKVIDESELIESLKKNKIRGAILDVFSKEPLPVNSIYYKMKNVVVTPHIAGNIDLVFNQIASHFTNSIKTHLSV